MLAARPLVLLVVLGAAAFASAPSAAAADCVSGTTNWTNVSGGDWNTATNWNNGVPTAACDTNIMGQGPYTVTLTTTASTKLLKIGAPGLKTINVSSNGAAAGITASGGILMGMNGEIVLDCPMGGCAGAAPFIDVGAAPSVLNNNGGKITVTPAAGDGTAALKGDVLNSGTLQFNGSGQIGVGAAGSFTQTSGTTAVGAGAFLDVTGTTDGAFHLNGGALSGDGTITGAVSNASGTVAPGSSPGTLTVTGNYTQGAAGTLDVDVNGTTGGQFDTLAVGGSATLGGTLALLPDSAFAAAAAPGDSVGFLTSTGARTGTFATTTVTPPLAGGKTFAASYGANGVNAVVGAAPAPTPLPAPTPTPTPPPTRDTTRPTLSGVGLLPRSFLARTGTTLKLTLSEAATISGVVNQSVRGHRVRGRCSPNAKTATRCTLTVRRAKLRFRGGKGANRLRLKVPSLKPGSYALIVTARDAAGNVSRSATLRFTIRTPPRKR